MNRYFESDINKLERLKKGFFVALASTVVCGVLTLGLATCYVVGETNDYPTTIREKRELAEIAENSSAYQKAYKNFEIGFKAELESGKITKKEFDKQMKYIKSPSFIDSVVHSATTAAINQKVEDRKENFGHCGKYAVLSGTVAGFGAAVTAKIKSSRKKLKKRWYSEEEGRGL